MSAVVAYGGKEIVAVCSSVPGPMRICGSEKTYWPNAGKSARSCMPYFAPSADAALSDVNGAIVRVAQPCWVSTATPLTTGVRGTLSDAAGAEVATVTGTGDAVVYVAKLWTTSTSATDPAVAPVPSSILRRAFRTSIRR